MNIIVQMNIASGRKKDNNRKGFCFHVNLSRNYPIGSEKIRHYLTTSRFLSSLIAYHTIFNTCDHMIGWEWSSYCDQTGQVAAFLLLGKICVHCFVFIIENMDLSHINLRKKNFTWEAMLLDLILKIFYHTWISWMTRSFKIIFCRILHVFL